MEEESEKVSEEVKSRIRESVKNSTNPEKDYRAELKRLANFTQDRNPSRYPVQEGRQHTSPSGPAANPHYLPGEEVRGLRNAPDPKDPETMPGPVVVRKAEESVPVATENSSVPDSNVSGE